MGLKQQVASRLLTKAARSAEQHSFLMAHALAAYRARYALSERSLAAALGCDLTALQGLALCRRPRPDAPDFAAQVSALAGYVGCNVVHLYALLQDVAVREPDGAGRAPS